MIKIKNLSKQYAGGKLAVNNLNLHVNKGEILGFIGPNGAGKTTTLKMLTGLLKPTSGEIEIAGYNIITNLIDVKKSIAYVPDHPEVFDEITGIEYLNFVISIYDLPIDESKSKIDELSKKFSIENDLNSKINSYSHGMKQKLLLVAAFMINPKLIIFDEPHVGLDPHAQRVLKELMKAHCEWGGTVIFSTHVLETVENLCSTVAIINNGEILATGTLDEIKGDRNVSLEDLFLEMTE